MTGGYIGSRTKMTEMSVNNGRWEIVHRASLPMPLAFSAALTINNQVYLFGRDRLSDSGDDVTQILKFDSYQTAWIGAGHMGSTLNAHAVQLLPDVSRFCSP